MRPGLSVVNKKDIVFVLIIQYIFIEIILVSR